MPNYYSPYNFYPASYPIMGQASFAPYANPQLQMPQQSFAQPQSGPKMMEWVEGEVGAKAYQMPNGWPANSPIPLWDSTDTVIWLKSWGPMGIPNPMQKLRYDMPEQQNQQMLMNGVSGQSGNTQISDMCQYVTKQDFEELKKDLRDMRNAMSSSSGNGQHTGNNQNGNQNRGGGK